MGRQRGQPNQRQDTREGSNARAAVLPGVRPRWVGLVANASEPFAEALQVLQRAGRPRLGVWEAPMPNAMWLKAELAGAVAAAPVPGADAPPAVAVREPGSAACGLFRERLLEGGNQPHGDRRPTGTIVNGGAGKQGGEMKVQRLKSKKYVCSWSNGAPVPGAGGWWSAGSQGAMRQPAL